MNSIPQKSLRHFAIKKIILFILFMTLNLAQAAFSLDQTLRRIEQNDPTLTSVRFWNFGEPSGKATRRLFQALAHNTHLQSIEVSMEAGMGTDRNLGIRLSNACLTNYSTNVRNNTVIKKWIVKDQDVRILATSLRQCTSLREVTFSNALFGHKHRVALAEAIRDLPNLTSARLEIDLNSTMANIIVQNTTLQKLDVSENVDLTLPEPDFISFLRGVHAHPVLQELNVEKSGEVYIYQGYFTLLAQNQINLPQYHLQTLITGLNLPVNERQAEHEPVRKKGKLIE